MANTLGGSNFLRGTNFIHPEAIKGYLECRKLLVERETQLVYMKCDMENRYEELVMQGKAVPHGFTGVVKSEREVIRGAAVEPGEFARFQPGESWEPVLSPLERELEKVRAEIAEIDQLISGKGNNDVSVLLDALGQIAKSDESFSPTGFTQEARIAREAIKKYESQS